MDGRRHAILGAAAEATRIHKEFSLRQEAERDRGSIDVFGAIVRKKLTLVFKPLDGLLGAFLPAPSPGIIITTKRPLSVQRLTGAHELGHATLNHEMSLDDDSLLTRSPFRQPNYTLVEVAADAFASFFMLPKWLLQLQGSRHKWGRKEMTDPRTVYQMSLRLGASYKATCVALRQHDIVDTATFDNLFNAEVKKIKQGLLEGYKLEDWHPDVWVLTEADEGSLIQGDPRDAFVLRLNEDTSAGYIWDIHELQDAGFLVFRDDRVIPDKEDEVGGPVERVLGVRPGENQMGHITLCQSRPWQEGAEESASLSFTFDLRGKEIGLARAERRLMVAA